jgi:RNA polymerase sigma factor (sigma-70 family)
LSFIKDLKNSTATDLELVHQYKLDGDIRVLAELYQRYMDLLYAVCIKYLKDQEAAKDAVMAIFEELISKLLKHEIVHFKGWLYMVAKNFCLMQLRSQKRIHIVQDPDIMQLTENLHLNGVFEKEEHLNQLSKCIDTLSPDQKQTVQLFYLQEKCYKEIAVITDTDWNKVRSLIQNARRNLKNCMDKNIISDSTPG